MAVGEKLRVCASKNFKEALEETAKPENSNILYFATDNNSILFNGKKIGIYDIKGLKNYINHRKKHLVVSKYPNITFNGDYDHPIIQTGVNDNQHYLVKQNLCLKCNERTYNYLESIDFFNGAKCYGNGELLNIEIIIHILRVDEYTNKYILEIIDLPNYIITSVNINVKEKAIYFEYKKYLSCYKSMYDIPKEKNYTEYIKNNIQKLIEKGRVIKVHYQKYRYLTKIGCNKPRYNRMILEHIREGYSISELHNYIHIDYGAKILKSDRKDTYRLGQKICVGVIIRKSNKKIIVPYTLHITKQLF